MNNFPLIETERLLLTWPNDSQIAQYHSDIVGSKMFDTILWDGPESDNDLKEYWAENKKSDPEDLSVNFNVGLIRKDTKQLIGGASLRPVEKNHELIDLGYALAPKFHGLGYGTEAVKALVDEAFLNRSAERVFATVFTGNDGSRRVLEKCNFALEGTLHRCVKKYGEWRDEWVFAITRPMWEKLRRLKPSRKEDS